MRQSANTPTILAGALLMLATAGAHAQPPLYRTVGPDGRVTFSDRAPNDTRAPAASFPAPAPSPAPTDNLPYELRQVANRYPVTLYTGKDCGPCASARSLLVSRGVPFTERTVTSREDIHALKSLSGEQSLPFGTIGSQHLKGFSDAEWTQYLDAAGYPRQSQLPTTWRQSEPTPLVAAKPIEPVAPAKAEAAPRAPAAQTAVPAQNSNPAGIRF